MKPIVKIGGLLIAVAMIAMLFLNPKSCGTTDGGGGADPVKPSKQNCSVRTASGSVVSGEAITYTMLNKSDKTVVDSLITLDGTVVSTTIINTEGMPLGRHTLKGRYTYADSSSCESSWSVEIKSDIKPTMLSYEILDMYEHNPIAYTQGLTYHAGRLYEGTGQFGESFIVDYSPGRLDYSDRIELDMDKFGEGITILGDKIYQLTWKSGKGFVYNLGDKQRVAEFELPSIEGWGLTDDGNSLIMSDGSNMLYYIDPVTFDLHRSQAVYNSEGPEMLLNELEYVNGYIYANIYGQSFIAQIDAATGKTIAYIDCRGILPPEFHTTDQDVFNGIAFNPMRQVFYLTGKYWNKMFEVRFVEQPA